MKLGDRLTGWVAEHQQSIINSEAKLDLGPEAAFAGLRYCMSLPLVSEGQLAGVLSLYAPDRFRDEQTQKLQAVLPHLALMFLSIEKPADGGIVATPARQLRGCRAAKLQPARLLTVSAASPPQSPRAKPSHRRDRRRHSRQAD